MKILKDLKNMFGFLDEDLDCQKIDNDRKETNEKMAISEVATEKLLPALWKSGTKSGKIWTFKIVKRSVFLYPKHGNLKLEIKLNS